MARPRFSSTLLLILTDTPVRLWNGFGQSAPLPDDDPLDPGGVYGPLPGNPNETPTMGPLPPLKQPIGGTAEALDFTFTGVESIPQDWVDNGSANGKLMYVGKIWRLNDGSIDGGVWWLRKFYIAQATDDGSAEDSVITLKVETAASYRARAGLRMFTPQSHRRDHPTDDFFNRVPLNARLRTLVWK